MFHNPIDHDIHFSVTNDEFHGLSVTNFTKSTDSRVVARLSNSDTGISPLLSVNWTTTNRSAAADKAIFNQRGWEIARTDILCTLIRRRALNGFERVLVHKRVSCLKDKNALCLRSRVYKQNISQPLYSDAVRRYKTKSSNFKFQIWNL